jgi:hypothetical protein
MATLLTLILWTLASLLVSGSLTTGSGGHPTSTSTAATTSCQFTYVLELDPQTPPVYTNYLTTTLLYSTIDCHGGCVENNIHFNEPVVSVPIIYGERFQLRNLH